MIPSTKPENSQRLVTAYLGHRLNKDELVDLAGRGDADAPAFEDTFASHTKFGADWRGDVAPEQVDTALDGLGLKAKFAALDETKVWSAEDRAIHRRLSQPDFDPGASAPEPNEALDSRFVATAGEAFSAWDRNGDLRLERQEIDFLMSGGSYGEKLDQANDPEKAAALATLLRYNELLGSAQPADGTGVSMADLQSWSVAGPLTENGAMVGVNEVYRENLDLALSLGSTPRPLAEENIDPGTIDQGVVGSCVLLSTTAGTSAEKLRSMMADNGDGTFTVTFADGASEQVNEPTLAERLHHAQGDNGERWPAILEIAAAQRLATEGVSTEHGLRGTIEGIDPFFAIPALSGKPAVQTSIDDLSLVQTRDLMEQATSTGGPVICGSRPRANGDFLNVEELHNGIANSHCYSVQGYDRETDLVSLQNPWHSTEWKFSGDPIDDGKFTMPLVDFYSSFRWVAAPAGDAEPEAAA